MVDPLRVVFFGTPAFALPTFNALLHSAHRVVGVVTQPDRPRGRYHKTTNAPVKARAAVSTLPILQPERLDDPAFMAALAGLGADLGVVAAYGKILTDAALATPRLGMINVHASLLPRYRGAAPVHRAIIDGQRETGVTIMRVVKTLDAGPMLARARRPIGPEETTEEVERDLARIGAGLLVATLDALAAGTAHETPQEDAHATYAHRLRKDEGVIDWTQPADRIHDLIRGLHPWPHAFTFHYGRRLILLRAKVAPESREAGPGTILAATGNLLRIAAHRGAVDILEMQTEGKRAMTAREFLAGHRIAPGERLTLHP